MLQGRREHMYMDSNMHLAAETATKIHFIPYSLEPVVTHQTSWLESTGVCGVQQKNLPLRQHGGSE